MERPVGRLTPSRSRAFVENSDLVFHQNWSPEESAQSSTWRELRAVSLAVEAVANHFPFLRLFGTPITKTSSLNGRRKADLDQLALLIFQICLKFRILLEVKWIPRDLNARADAISKLIDNDDYSINDAIFESIDHFWGAHTVDRFAYSYNAKVPRLLKHMELCKARGTVILPLWKYSCFWTLFCSDGVHWNSFVVDWVVLPKFPGHFITGKARNTLFGVQTLRL